MIEQAADKERGEQVSTLSLWRLIFSGSRLHSLFKGPMNNHSMTLIAPAIRLIGRHLFTYLLTYFMRWYIFGSVRLST